MKRRFAAVVLLAIACAKPEAPKPQASPIETPVADTAERMSMCDIARGGTIISRTGEAVLDISALQTIDGDPGTFWMTPVHDVPQSITIGLPGTTPPGFDPDVLPVGYVDRWFGNDAIWVRLPRDGLLPARPREGNMIGAKFPWWRVLSGQLQASSRRLGSEKRIDADVNTVAQYGPRGFVPSDLVFDGPGCWDITGSLNGRTLSFVAIVVAVT